MMTEVTVLDTGGENIAGEIARGIAEYGGNSGDVLVNRVSTFKEIMFKRPDVLVITEHAARSCQDQRSRIGCGILLLPGDVAACDTDADIFDAECIVSYGMSPKNTITFSSISEESCVLALQREFVTTCGDVLERQEIKIKGGLRPDSLLAVAGALLILGLKIPDSND